jgi:hypothetical protein
VDSCLAEGKLRVTSIPSSQSVCWRPHQISSASVTC